MKSQDLEVQIKSLKNELDRAIERNEYNLLYREIQVISVRLDELICQYYHLKVRCA